MNVRRPVNNNVFISLTSISKYIWAPKFQSFSLHTTNWLSIVSFFLRRPFGFHLLNEKVMELVDLPPAGVVFAIDLDDDGVNRAVCNDDVSLPRIVLPSSFVRCSSWRIFFTFHWRQTNFSSSIVVRLSMWKTSSWISSHCPTKRRGHRPKPFHVPLFRYDVLFFTCIVWPTLYQHNLIECTCF